MYPHHEETIGRLVEHFSADPSVEAVFLAGSIAHGFETPASDAEVMLLASAERYAELAQHCTLTVYNKELGGYPGGYVDGEDLSTPFLDEVAARAFPRRGRRGSPPQVLRAARGATVGRNVWGFDEITGSIAALKAVIHDGALPVAAARAAGLSVA